MQFGPVPLDQAEGTILAHSVALPEGRLRKGCLLGPAEIAILHGLGRTEVIVARLGSDDLHEDAAALAIANALVTDPLVAGLEVRVVGTGRVNLHATVAGIAGVLADRVNALNAVDPMITLATVPQWQRLRAGEMVATVKVIAYGVAQASVRLAAEAGRNALRMHPAKLTRAALIQTVTTEDDGESGHRAIQQRLHALNVVMQPKRLVPHR
jgi:molybdenum cofactor cytidylyltransferase